MRDPRRFRAKQNARRFGHKWIGWREKLTPTTAKAAEAVTRDIPTAQRKKVPFIISMADGKVRAAGSNNTASTASSPGQAASTRWARHEWLPDAFERGAISGTRRHPDDVHQGQGTFPTSSPPTRRFRQHPP